MIYQTVNIAMNNAWILYSESTIQRNKAYDKKAEYLHKIAYRMSRPFAVEKYQCTNHRHQEVKTMIDMVFRLNPQEQVGAPAMAPAPADAPDVANAHQHQHTQRQQLLALGENYFGALMYIFCIFLYIFTIFNK